jgi:hypothetical protein
MAQYYGTIQGNKGEASRLGHKTSGLIATASGWHLGAKVYLYWNEESQCDVIRICVTDGSNGSQEKCVFEGTNIEQLRQVQ